MTLDLGSLRKSVGALDRSLAALHSADANSTFTDDVKDTLRAGVVKSFEVAYEMCWKYIQRWLRENTAGGEIELPRTRKDLFRLAAQRELIAESERWFEYGDARNLTAHTYDETVADEVCAVAGKFLDDARDLLHQLAERND